MNFGISFAPLVSVQILWAAAAAAVVLALLLFVSRSRGATIRAIALGLISSGLRYTVFPRLPLAPLLGIAVVEILLTVPYRRWVASRRALGALIYTQFIVDNLLFTFGLSLAPELPNEFHFLYLLTIVPCALFSALCGMVMVTIATIGRLMKNSDMAGQGF